MITNKQVLDQIKKRISKKPLFYVTRNKERGSGLGEFLIRRTCSLRSQNLAVRYAHSKNPSLRSGTLKLNSIRHKSKYFNYKIVTSTPLKDTAEILEKKSFPLKSNIIVFKNNVKIQRLTKQKNLKLLNPDYRLAEKYENKISQYKWLKTIIPANLLKTVITTPDKNSFQKLSKILGSSFIGQFNRSHSGQGTLLISQNKQWEELIEKFPKRQIKCTQFINNPVITVNVCLWQKCVLMGNPSYQITGLKQLTDFPYSTTGNDWSLAQKILNLNDFKTIKALSQKIGQAMIKNGWQGLFGLDFIKGKKWLVIEINARQPASTGLETALQKKQGKGITIFTAHVAALLQLPLFGTCEQTEKSFQKIDHGAQIIIRKKNKNKNPSLRSGTLKLNSIRHKSKYFNYSLKFKKLKQTNIKIIKGDLKTEKHNTELFRIQNLKTGFITKNNQLNSFAKKLLKNFK